MTDTNRASLDNFDYNRLMQRRINRILLICSSYDAYILEEDGRLDIRINQEYRELNLTNTPTFIRVSTTAEALEVLSEEHDIDLVISMYNVGEPDVFTFARRVKEMRPELLVVLLTHFTRNISRKLYREDQSGLDYVFCWHGNPELIIAIVKLIEDRMNADEDILGVGVQCILLVEDSIRYYSSYLPAIYRIVMKQSQEFVREAMSEQQQMMRKRSRPKILLATNYDDAVTLYTKYKNNLLGIISDVGFIKHKGDNPDDEKIDAGIELCRFVREDNPYLPFLMQSSQASVREVARELGVGFLEKYSDTLLQELESHITAEFQFGDFIFRDPATKAEVARARDLREMQTVLETIPDKVLLYHISNQHISKWLNARGIFALAHAFGQTPEEMNLSLSETRAFLVESIGSYRILLSQGIVTPFSEQTYSDSIWMARIGEGSLGGKGRGLAFMNSMLQKHGFYDKYPGVRVMLPRTLVVATDYFDEFMELNGLLYLSGADVSDEEILSEFVSSRLPEGLLSKLRVFIRYASGPLAVRSSSKLEDSHYQPFAGIYSTYMIPLADNEDRTLRLLGKAIKGVYASVFFTAARQYITASGNMLSEEKMAVVIQEVCGSEEGGFFFPTLSGVARSLNFYPLGNERPEEGVAEIATGLGKLVVDGGRVLRFSPRYPRHVLQLSVPELALRETQREMYVLDLRPEQFKTSIYDAVNLRKIDINEARNFRNMKYAASTWDANFQNISDSMMVDGPRIITFARILKYNSFPLAEILADLLEMSSHEMRGPVEIEFAANLDVPSGANRVFNFLQIRPIVDSENRTSLDWSRVSTDDALLWAQSAVGAGAVECVQDVVYVKPEAFDKMRTADIASEISLINNRMKDLKRGYVLIGPGRWGSSVPSLGVPVKWGDISEASVIVECGLPDFRVDPSQGTHFFQNIISFGVGYLTINPFMGDGGLDIGALDAAETLSESDYVRHVRFPEPLYVFVDGRNNKAIIKTQSL
jgi:CheY-like chemotaxis protein